MKYIYLFLFIFATACGTIAQTTSPLPNNQNKIVIDATGEAQAAADLLNFNIHLNRFDADAESAFEQHKELERFLTDLLLNRGFDPDDINANPISISPRRYSDEQGFETSQNVSIQMDDITEFETMQIELITNGFDSFSGQFSSSEVDAAKTRALTHAVEQARSNAQVLADAAGKQLGEVISIEFTSSSGPVYREAMALSRADMSDGGMLQFQTSIPVQQNVRVVFELLD